jgi:hypothetical protein
MELLSKQDTFTEQTLEKCMELLSRQDTFTELLSRQERYSIWNCLADKTHVRNY